VDESGVVNRREVATDVADAGFVEGIAEVAVADVLEFDGRLGDVNVTHKRRRDALSARLARQSRLDAGPFAA
jgi:hypothetical protein